MNADSNSWVQYPIKLKTLTKVLEYFETVANTEKPKEELQ